MTSRKTTIQRKTNETSIDLTLDLDGTGESDINTGIGFLDHLLTILSHHSGIDISLTCKGDLHIDDHHTAEDCALTIGSGIDEALGDRAGITRFGHAYAPLDESMSRAVIDLSGRPFASVSIGLAQAKLGSLAAENVGHVLRSLATASRMTLHVDLIKGSNDHHRAEAAFKGTALALRQAVRHGGSANIPSTKGSL